MVPEVLPGRFEDADGGDQQGNQQADVRLWNGLRRDSPYPAPSCGKRDRKLKKHAIGAHLSPLFTDVLTTEQMASTEFHRRRLDVVKDLARWVLNRRDATPHQLVGNLRQRLFFSSMSEVPRDTEPGLKKLCEFAGWRVPKRFCLQPINSPACVMYWRVALNMLRLLPADKLEPLKTLHCLELELVPAGAESVPSSSKKELIMDPPVYGMAVAPVDDNREDRRVVVHGASLQIRARNRSPTPTSRQRHFLLVDGVTFVGHTCMAVNLQEVKDRGEAVFNLWKPVNVYWECVPVRDDNHLDRIPDQAVLTVTDRTL